MPRTWIFVDEQGDPKYGARNSTYFGLAAIVTRDPVAIGTRLDGLRHELWSHEHVQRGYFHAQEDCHPVRRRVAESIADMPIDQAVVVSVTKANVFPDARAPRVIYATLLRTMFERLQPGIDPRQDLHFVLARWPAVPDLPVVGAAALSEVITPNRRAWQDGLLISQTSASAHAGLQVADYVAWASGRQRGRGERGWLTQMRSGTFRIRDWLEF